MKKQNFQTPSNMMKWITPSVAALSCCLPFARAQNAELLTPLVVTATGSEKSVFDTSLPVNLLEARELDEKVTISLSEIFQYEPGVDAITAGPGSIQPVIRGLSGERVLVLVNGIRLSEQRPGGNHVFSLDPAQIERVEVVRGPASVLYGSDAIGGVMNFITKRADEESGGGPRFRGESDVAYQSNGEGMRSSGHLRFGQNRFNAYLGGVYRDTANIKNPTGEVPNSFYEGYTLWAGGNYSGKGWKTWADYSFMEADIGIPSIAAFAEDYFKGEKHQRLALGFEATELPESMERFSLDFGWQRHNRHRYRRMVIGTPPPVLGDLAVNIRVDIDTYTLKPQIVFAPNEMHRITAGIDTFYEDASSDRTIRDTGSAWVNPAYDNVPVIPDSSRTGAGVFVQDEITVGDRWVVTPGLRWDWIEAQTDGHPRHQLTNEETSVSSALSGNLGLLYKATETVNLYANIGRAFRSPTLLELYFDGPHDALGNDIGDPDLDPETSWNFDIGVKTRSDRLQTTVSGFYNIVDNYIVQERQLSGDRQYKNYTKAVLYGAEAALDYDLGAGFTTFASLSYVRGKNDDTGSDLPGIPPLKARYGLRYETSLGSDSKFWAEISGLTASSQNHIGTNERQTGGYTRGDVRLGVDVGNTWSLVAAVENFTDKLYQDHLSSPWQESGLNDQPGRCVKLMVKARF